MFILPILGQSALHTATHFHDREVRAEIGRPLVENIIGSLNGDPQSLQNVSEFFGGVGLAAVGVRSGPSGKLKTNSKINTESAEGPEVNRRIGDMAGGADAEMGMPSREEMVQRGLDTTVHHRKIENLSTHSSAGIALDGDNILSPVRVDIKSPDGNAKNNIHAEEQLFQDLNGKPGQKSIVVDNVPCGSSRRNCAQQVLDRRDIEVIVPNLLRRKDDPINPKTAADRAAKNGESVIPRRITNDELIKRTSED